MAPRDNLVLAIIWYTQYLGARDNYVRAKIWCGENRSENGLELRHQTKTRGLLHGTSLVFFISHFYRAYKNYFFSLKFSYEHSETSPNFFVYALLYFQNNECKKKSPNSRGKSRAMETHFYTMELFFSFTKSFP